MLVGIFVDAGIAVGDEQEERTKRSKAQKAKRNGVDVRCMGNIVNENPSVFYRRVRVLF